MIISAPKPLDELKAALAPYTTLAIIGCGGCAAVCQAGGTRQVDTLAESLDGKQVALKFQIDEPCDRRILSRELRRITQKLEGVDAVVVLACGVGVQAIAAEVERPVLTGLNTLFPGTVIHSGEYMEICRSCGECILNETVGICPRTLCPKGITNGPCSEKLDDKCPVDGDSQCVWISMADRAQKLGLAMPDLDFTHPGGQSQYSPRRIRKSKARAKAPQA
jgi:ferredoxin